MSPWLDACCAVIALALGFYGGIPLGGLLLIGPDAGRFLRAVGYGTSADLGWKSAWGLPPKWFWIPSLGVAYLTWPVAVSTFRRALWIATH